MKEEPNVVANTDTKIYSKSQKIIKEIIKMRRIYKRGSREKYARENKKPRGKSKENVNDFTNILKKMIKYNSISAV